MNFSAETKDILGALAPAARAAQSGASVIPILRNAKIIAAASGEVTLTCTDLDKSIATRFQADVKTAGSTTAPADRLLAMVKLLHRGSQVGLSLEETSLKVISGRSRFTLPVLPIVDFPQAPAHSNPVQIELLASALAEALTVARHAISSEETRYYLNGVYLHQVGGLLRAVATDGHRLTRVDTGIAVPPDLPPVIIPTLAIEDIIRACATGDRASLSIATGGLVLECGALRLATKVIDATFPDYDRITPRDFVGQATIEREGAERAFARMGLVDGVKGGVGLTFADRKLTLERAADDASSTASDEIEADYDGPPFTIHLGRKYASEALAAMGGDTIKIEWVDPGSPLKIMNAARNDRFEIVMPTRG